ncbi:MAG TPA: hypothetical protein VJM53_09855 [Burkholderiales bacterium]|nr:hypothetical protein [Burkholderiales bacterium]
MLDFLAARKDRIDEEGPGPDETRAWLSSLNDVDTTAMARALIDRLVGLNRAPLQARLHLRLLDMFSEHAAKLIPELELRIARVRPPVSGNARQVAYLVEKLYKELAVGYFIVVTRAPRSWLSPGFKRQIHRPLVQAMDYHASRLALSEKLYAPAPRGVWAALHRLYRLAQDWKIAEREAADSHASPMRIYREALLLDFAQPQQFGPRDFKHVQQLLREWSHLATLELDSGIADPSGLFLLDVRGDSAGVAYGKRAERSTASGRPILNTTKLLAHLQTELKQLRAPTMHRELNHEPGFLDLYQRLLENWRGERLQRGVRSRFHPRADVWMGLNDVWRLLRESSRSPQTSVQASGEWLIVNESARGFALKYMSGSAPQLTVGELIALRGAGEGKVHVCVGRWIVSNSPEHLEIGLEQLAPVVIPAWYQIPDSERATTESVLYLPSIPGPQQTALLIATPGKINTARTIDLLHGQGGRISLYATRVAETTASVEFIEVIPV